jgi:hypothetical protein
VGGILDADPEFKVQYDAMKERLKKIPDRIDRCLESGKEENAKVHAELYRRIDEALRPRVLESVKKSYAQLCEMSDNARSTIEILHPGLKPHPPLVLSRDTSYPDWYGEEEED